ncbi:MAG: hypothetical protein AB3N10_04845 [Allomuricauda sp.]
MIQNTKKRIYYGALIFNVLVTALIVIMGIQYYLKEEYLHFVIFILGAAIGVKFVFVLLGKVKERENKFGLIDYAEFYEEEEEEFVSKEIVGGSRITLWFLIILSISIFSYIAYFIWSLDKI